MKKVLIVEDDPFIRDISAVKLGEHGYEVIASVDGASALTILEKESVDVVLLDLDLPDMSGFDLVTSMKTQKPKNNIRFLVFSNRDDDETKQKAQELGITGFFTKVTTDYNELFAKIDSE